MAANDFVERQLAKGESARLELKASIEPMSSIARTICAFLNTHGGMVIVGVDGKKVPNGTVTQEQCKILHKFIQQQITPQALCDVVFDQIDQGHVITISVPAGLDPPYVFDGSVFLRKNGTTTAADASALRSMVTNSALAVTRWERRPALGLETDDINITLFNETIERAKKHRGYQFNDSKDLLATMSQLSLARSGQLTNGADVLFGNQVALRHPQTRMRAACYKTDRADDFLDEQLFEGPSFHLLSLAIDFIKRHVPIYSGFTEGQLQRQTQPKYPFLALREALVNALVHRDYSSFSGSVSLSIYSNRIEIWNTGQFPQGISLRDLALASHPSILVNPDIAHIFYLHELMECVGRGTYKIAQECRLNGMSAPEWKNLDSGVKLTLFAATQGASPTINLNPRQKQLLDFLKPGDNIRVSRFVEQQGNTITDRQARRDLTDLEGYGLLIRRGAGPKTTYERTSQMP